MPYDGGDLYVKVELYINGAFVEVTTRARGGRAASGVEITRGRGTGAIQAEASTCSLTLGNADGYATEGNPFSPWYGYFGRGCRIRVSIADVAVGGDVVRFDGEIDTIVAVYPGGSDSSVRITATGILGGQLGLGSDPLRSAPQRYLTGLTATVPVAAWLLEDGPLVAAAAPVYGTASLEPFVGTHPSGAVITYPQWGRGSLAPWLPNVINRSSSSGLSAIWAAVSMPSFTNTWTVDLAYTSTTDAPISTVDVNPSYLGGSIGWPQLTFSPVGGEVKVSFDGSPETTTSVPALFDGLVHHVRWTATQSGANVTWAVYVDSVLVNSGTELTYTLPAMTVIAFVSEGGSTASALGYASVWTTPGPVADYTSAVMGHAGELVHERMERLCAEEDIVITIAGTSAQAMGPQGMDKLAELLIDGEAVDGGLLSDGGSGGGLAYRCLSSIYSQAASLAVTQGSLDVDVAPVWDNRNVRNDVTISRPGGSFAHVTDEAHIVRTRRRIKDSDSLNIDSDEPLRDQASWRVNVGTSDGPRYNGVGINMRNSYGRLLADAVLVLEMGDRFTAAQATLPPQHPPGGIDGLVIGWREELDKDKWLFAPNVVPYAPYQVAVYGVDPGGVVSRYGAATTTLAEDLTSVETAADVATGTDIWATTASHPSAFPFNVTIGGLVYSCTGITGTHPNLTLTLVRLATDKAHSTGAAVTVTDTGRYGL